jgi:hypothetical protein
MSYLLNKRYPYSIPLKGFIQNGEPTNVGVGSPWLLDTSHPRPPKKVSQARKPLNGEAKKLSSNIYGIPFLMSSKLRGFQYASAAPLASKTSKTRGDIQT